MLNDNSLGKDGFVWWFGRVEDLEDPLNCGRVRVRPYGWYSPDIPLENLPWAHCMESITSAASEGIGISPTGLAVGSYVVGFFLDAHEAQRPMVLGSFSGIPGEEPDVSRLARGEEPENPKQKNEGRTTGVAHPGGSWDEPESAYAAQYPNNHVRTTKSGHIREYDDTPDNERIHEYHKAGTFYEIDSEGNRVVRIVGNAYEIVAGNENVNIKGNCNLTVDSNCNTRIKGNWNIEVDGDKVESIKGSKNEEVTGDVQESYNGNQNTEVGGNVEESYGGNQTTEAGGNIAVTGSRIDLNQ